MGEMRTEKSANDPLGLFERPKPSCGNCRFARQGINTVVCHLHGMAPPVKKIFRPQATVCENWQRRTAVLAKDGRTAR